MSRDRSWQILLIRLGGGRLHESAWSGNEIREQSFLRTGMRVIVSKEEDQCGRAVMTKLRIR